MTQDKRKFCGTFSVRMGTGERIRIELASAVEWGGPAGLYRVRVNRRWRDLPEGGPAFFSLYGVSQLAASLALGRKDELPTRPDLPRGSVISAPNGTVFAGQRQYDVTRTATEPFRGFDGRWYVATLIFGQGLIMLPVEDVIVKKKEQQ